MHNIVLRGALAVTTGCLVLLYSTSIPAYTEKQVDDTALPEMVVEAENQVRQEIRKSSFEFPLNAAVIDTFYVSIDEGILAVSPVQGLNPYLNNPVPLSSRQVPHYWLQEPATSPVVTFFPEDPEGHKARSWALTVTDYRGSTFRTFDKKGKPPGKVEWDGRGDRDDMLQVGYPYSYVFSVTDKGTNTYNYAGTSFRIPAVDYMEGTERRLEFSGDVVFRIGSPKLQESGEGWLIGAADRVRKDHPYSPLKVVVYAEAKSLAQKRAEAVAEFLADQMVLGEGWIETEAIVRPDLRAEMDGSVSICVGHAEKDR